MNTPLSLLLKNLFGFNENELSENILCYRWEGMSALDGDPKNLVFFNDSMQEKLPMEDFHFTYAVSNHPFFYNSTSSEAILLQLKELIRVAKEVRLAPYFLEQHQVKQQLGPVILALQQDGIGVEIRPLHSSGYGQAVLIKLWAQECKLA